VLDALDLVRRGKVEDALAVLAQVDVTFVRKRLRHYAAAAPDHREAATVLSERYEARRAAERVGRVPVPAQQFEAPLPSAVVENPPADFIDFGHPEDFLQWTSGDWEQIPELDLGVLHHVDVWAIVALACLRLAERPRRPPLRDDSDSGAARFAHALGLTELSGGALSALNEPTRTVRLTRVRSAREIEPAAERMASLVIRSDQAESMRLAIRHVLVELLRNVIQHSGDPLGAVVAGQAMGPAQRRQRPMIQLAVADAGIGIPRHLQRKHPHLRDYRQALERALLPHISGTFEEGLTGSFENAGLGLYVISEMARQTAGNLLIATTGAALVVKNEQGNPGHPAFLKPPGTGFPGTLVAFEIPTDAVQDYHALMKRILEKTRERTPKRASDRWITFEAAPAGSHRVLLEGIKESTPDALIIASRDIEPAILRRQPVELDFAGIDLCTQSWLHALLYESIRLAWARRVPIHVVNSDLAVTEGLRFLEAYALGG
jgi:anti-sigma regulatory factor (Ser/Thr protein kinase)